MIIPTGKPEAVLFARGVRLVAGVDEVGRGPLAGPVVAAAVASGADRTQKLKDLVVRDSKTMSALQRDKSFEVLTAEDGVIYGIGIVSSVRIDEIGILPATLQAMREAVVALSEEPDHLLIDGRSVLEDISISQTAAPRLDGDSWLCAAASIIAKVTRDRMMVGYHEQYPVYGFDRHKGYGTAVHRAAILKNGSCLIHRQSFTLV